MQVGGADVKRGKREDLFAATPPLEATTALVTRWPSMPGMSLDFFDLARAYFHVLARGKVYVELPFEDHEAGTRGASKNVMYGTRIASQNWEMEYGEKSTEVGFG